MHQVKQSFEELRTKMYVKLRGYRESVFVIALIRDARQIRGKVLDPDNYDSSSKDPRVTVTVDYSAYEYSYLESPDSKLAKPLVDQETTWGQCEIHYGINHHGSADPDPVRAMALAVLRGDSSAIIKMTERMG